jgi:hypothetical protein
MASQRCPRCQRSDAVAKVTAIVRGGTRYITSSSTKISPTLSDDDADWTFSFNSVNQTSQTVLAKQLDFPDKGGGAMWFGWGFCIFFGLGAAMYNLIRSDVIKHGGTDEVLDFIVPACTTAAIICAVVALIATPIHKRGRSQALTLWSELYYCFRDDVVYLPGDFAKCAPPSHMRAIINY